jgi:hypothetical protein
MSCTGPIAMPNSSSAEPCVWFKFSGILPACTHPHRVIRDRLLQIARSG